jgi:hypothetical protein
MKKSYAPHKTKVLSNHAYQNTTISDVERNTSASSNWSEISQSKEDRLPYLPDFTMSRWINRKGKMTEKKIQLK